LHENKSKQSRGGSRGELTSRVVVEDPRGSGKKRGVAVVVGEEEGRRLRGEEGRRLSSSRKKRGAAVVVRGRRARGGAPS
jgi:hypothetical protein